MKGRNAPIKKQETQRKSGNSPKQEDLEVAPQTKKLNPEKTI